MITVVVPSALRQYTSERAELQVQAEAPLSLAALLDWLGRDLPAFNRKIRDETGQLRRFVNIYLEGEESRRLSGLATLVQPDAEVLIIQSVAGG